MNPLVLTALSLCGYLAAAFVAMFSRHHEWENLRLSSVISMFAGILSLISAMAVIVHPIGYTLQFSLFYDVFVLDKLSALLLLVIAIVAIAAAGYAMNYLDEYLGKGARSITVLFNLFAGAMTALVAANQAIAFLIIVEIISLSSFALVIQGNTAAHRKAGLHYLVMDHVANVFIVATFAILAYHANSLMFSDWIATPPQGELASLTFVLALIGFGIKSAGIFFHEWLPKAYPLAPSHCATLMSCVMVKLGVYGLLKVAIVFLGATQWWWGLVVLIFGALSSVLGVMFALAEHNIKQLLAYHSVENIGIILMGVGVSMMGIATDHMVIAVLGLLGALYHLLNHAVFKGLLCLGSGSLVYRLHTKDMEKMGGLAKRMPKTALTFLIGSMAISALPPLNGFVSEWFIYQSLFSISQTGSVAHLVFGPFGAVMLALTGALACMCFVKVYGICFGGAAKSDAAENATEVGNAMVNATIGLSVLCVVLGIASPWIAPYIADIASATLQTGAVTVAQGMSLFPASNMQALLSTPLILCALALLLLVPMAILAFHKRQRLANRHQGDPWACGYQYEQKMTVSAGGITQPMRHMFRYIYQSRPHRTWTERFLLSQPAAGQEISRWAYRRTMAFWIGLVVLCTIFFPLISGVM